MTTTIIKSCEQFKLCTGSENKEITGIYCCDLLSHVMGQALQGNVWCTVMGNINTIAVASLTDAACVVLCHDIPLTEDMLKKAEAQDITVYTTSLSEFDAGLLIAKKCGLV